MSDRKLRRDDVLISILNHEVKTSAEYDFTKVQQLPDYTYLYGRFYTILSEKPLKENNRLEKAIVQTCKEFRNIWITMNALHEHSPKVFKNVERFSFISHKGRITEAENVVEKESPDHMQRYAERCRHHN